MLIKIQSVLFVLLCIVMPSEPKVYHKNYTEEGILKAEGWMMGEMRVQYWKFYHKNGEISSKGHYEQNVKESYWYYYNEQGKLIREGHYTDGIAEKWWVFYDLATREKRKIQYQNGKREGFCLVYKNGSLAFVEKYKADTKVGTWDNLRSFKRDNPNVSF